jgi:hypothetical protein
MPEISTAIPEFMEHRLSIIESEVQELKQLIKKTIQTSRVKKPPHRLLRGILKGLKVNERDIEQAKRSLFKNVNLL